MNSTTTIPYRAGRNTLCAAVCSLVFSASALAVPIVSESFDYTGDSQTLGGRAGAGEIGWDGSWSVNVNPLINTGGITVEPGSLSLSTYATSGNRVRVTANDGSTAPATNAYVSFSRSVNVNVGSVGGDMWQSFLYKRIDDTFNGQDDVNNVGDGLQDGIRISTEFELRIRPKRQNIDGLQLRYRSHSLGEELEAPVINDGDTFLFVARFENLGETVDDEDLQTGAFRQAQLWVLDAAGYDAVVAGSTLYDEAVQINNARHGGSEVSMLDAGDLIAMLHLYKDRAAVLGDEFTTEWDELRYGDSIDDVLPGFTNADIGVAPVILAADFDGDDDVDGADFMAWQQGLGTAGASKADGDADANGTVDAADLGIWEAEFGTRPLALSAAVVPEPSSFLLASLAMLFMGRFSCFL